ncbi:hypothetical protein E6R18_20755 [Streptomyces sp. A1277]|nr:hypothetical protein E6R18_20755 [Streptomyces sp. A1277]
MPGWTATARACPADLRGAARGVWSDANPYGTFRLNMVKRLDLRLTAAVPRPRTPADTADRSGTGTQGRASLISPAPG